MWTWQHVRRRRECSAALRREGDRRQPAAGVASSVDELRRLDRRPRPGRPAAGAVLRRSWACRCSGIDNDPARLEALGAGRMPFRETGTQELLDRTTLALSDRIADAAQARHIVITLGTPSFSHIEIDMRDIRQALDDLLPVLRTGHSVILRSTIAPGTTAFVAGYLRKHRGFEIGTDVYVSHAPERIAAGPFPRGDRHPPVHHRRRRRGVGPGRGRAVRGRSARRSSRRRRPRPSWRRSGRTSCGTRTSRCRTC